MSQRGVFVAREAPADITVDLPAGSYLAQVRGQRDGFGAPRIVYATAEAAPTVGDATEAERLAYAGYFQADAGESFAFRVGDGIEPTWVAVSLEWARAMGGGAVTVPVAVARTGA